MRLKRLGALGSALVLSISSLLIIVLPGVAHAAGTTLYWCNASGGNFSTASNWNTNSDCSSGTAVVPGTDGNSDNLIFDDTALSSSISEPAVTDDISALTVNSVTFQGSSGTYSYQVGGTDSITITGGVSDNTSATFPTGFANPVIVSGNQTFTLANTSENTLFESLQGSGNVAVTGGSGGEFDDLSAYTGTISSSDSMIQLGNNSGTFTSSGSVAVSGAGILDLLATGGGKSNTTNTYNLPISIGGTGSGKDAALNLDGSQDTDVTNVLSAAVTFTSNAQVSATGANTLNITGAITYGGFTFSSDGANTTTITVSGGTNDSADSPTVGSNVTYVDDGTVGSTTVASGGIFKGSGTVNGLSVNTGGTVAPGDAPACTTVNGNFTENGTYSPEIQSPGTATACPNPDYDQIIVTGAGSTVNLTNGTLNVDLLSGFNPSTGQTFDILNNQGGSAITGTFAGLAQGAVFSVGSTKFQISYTGGTSGQDVVLTVVAPSTPVTASAGTTPKAPDTGLAATRANPWTILAVSLMTSVFLFGLAFRLEPDRLKHFIRIK